MIDLHSHILAGIDDGARDMAMSLDMARMAVADGTRVIAATPHITPGVYNNDAWVIGSAVEAFRTELSQASIPLDVVMGADVHVSPAMSGNLVSGDWPRLAGTRFFLFEPPHHVMPPRLVDLVRNLMGDGLLPVLTHPERLTWIENHYDVISDISQAGAAIQITSGSVTGTFGRRARYWSERMLDEGLVDIVASDAHNTSSRPPLMSEARDMIGEMLGEELAWRLVRDNPAIVLGNGELPKKHRETATIRPSRSQSRGAAGRRKGRQKGFGKKILNFLGVRQ